MQKDLITKLHRTFEDSVPNEDGVEFWYARDLQRLLDYTHWRNFELVIEKAETARKNSNNEVSDHFADVSKVIEAGKCARYTEAAP
jgi:DNA-damage-inducible protein D